ncbi:ParB/RepB/Spo0J family partition protein [Xanthomonas euvesicatoria]|uniref:ParB/RepB/Spo0J family partition protein n=1 Tax=Xanthomonas euvesicatoria TaxID=456327 RepID=UPI001E49499B|nr:ParB/RepB/Spo0J family partition protein [Xanthomonas euvesicatoria]MCC8612804.1 ParB/RepB/Spo0J family partition protein [Xanthomonas euvesicatoria pv. euvesicatoria]
MKKQKPDYLGLESALAGLSESSNLIDLPIGQTTGEGVSLLPVSVVHPDPDQPRKEFDPQAITELADSIKAQGLLQPIVVRPHPSRPGEWMIVMGERRWQAHKEAKLSEIRAIQTDTAAGSNLLVKQMVENVQRSDLTQADLVAGYARLADEHNMSATQIAEHVGRSKQVIGDYLAVRKMDPAYLDALKRGVVAGITTLVELWRAREQLGEAAGNLLAEATPESQITRSRVRRLVAGDRSESPSSTPPVLQGSAVLSTMSADDGTQKPASDHGDGADKDTLHATSHPVKPAAPQSGKTEGGTQRPARSPTPSTPPVRVVVGDLNTGDELGLLELTESKNPGHALVRLGDGGLVAYPINSLRLLRLEVG